MTLGSDVASDDSRVGRRAYARFAFSVNEHDVVTAARKKYGNATAFEVILTSFLRAVWRWTGKKLRVDLAHHGRPSLAEGLDISRTAGLMFYDVPFAADFSSVEPSGTSLRRVQERLQAIPRGGLGFALLSAFGDEPRWQRPAPLALNYQRLAPIAESTGAKLAMVPLPIQLGFNVLAAVDPALVAFQEHLYEGQVRWFVLDTPNEPLACYVGFPTERVSRGHLAELFAMFESELLGMM
jgi:hypothetical protein